MGEFLQTLLIEPNISFAKQQCLQRLSSQSNDKTIQPLQTHNSDNQFAIDLTQLSTLFCTSERNLRRKCQRLFGISPNEVLTQYRIHKAKTLLKQGNAINDVAYAVGFTTHSHFSTVFKKVTGMSPKEYKKQ
jgi:AraC-like DNA-binding protein